MLSHFLGTVLANEEIINGLSERGNHPVVRQPLRQWILKITQYADKLEDGLDSLQWPEGTLSAQKQWIGRSVGASIQFKVESSDSVIEVFTTRPDTIMGVTYVVLAPEHPLVSKLTTAENKASVEKYIKEVVGKSDMERTSTGVDRGKTGVPLGAFAVHPITGEKVLILHCTVLFVQKMHRSKCFTFYSIMSRRNTVFSCNLTDLCQ